MSRAIIKPGSERFMSLGSSGLELRDIAAKAENVLAAAREEAAKILANARSEAAKLHEAARREGFEEGKTTGQKQGRDEGLREALEEARKRLKSDEASLVSALKETVRSFSADRERMLSVARRDAVVLAVAIAGRICHKLSHIDEAAIEMAREACTEALQLISESTEAVIRVHPQDAAAVSELAAELADSVRSARGVQLTADESVGRGGVVVATSNSVVDATVVGRIERIADELISGWRARLEGWKKTP